MKRIAKYIIALGASLTAVSCGNEFLNVDYWSIVNPDGVYADADNVKAGLIGCYAAFYIDSYNGVFAHPAIANYPSLDMQAEGWDAELTTHSWGVEAKSGFFKNAWGSTYKMIVRTNLFLNDLQNTVSDDVVPPATKKIYEAEARGLRAYCYYMLTTMFSRVPMLLTGETYANSPEKARPASDDEAWAKIKEDFQFAADNLDWKAADGEIGRFTKTAALAYLGKTYMYLKDYENARKCYEQIIAGSGKQLDPCQGMVHALRCPDNYETIWALSYPELTLMNWSGGSYASNEDRRFAPMQTRPDEYGGWGDSPVSFEHLRSYEPGDKRLLYNIVGWGPAQDGKEYKLNIFTKDSICLTPKYKTPFQISRSCIPNVHNIKYWHTNEVFSANSMQMYRYAGMLLDYAECCFETGKTAEGWKVLNDIRNRAWGNLEVGVDVNANRGTIAEKFPVEFLNTEIVPVPDAETVYTEYKAKKGWKSPTWLVAVFQERRKEIMYEHSFWFDITRRGSDFAQEWLDVEYPKNGGATFYNTVTGKYYVPEGNDKNQPWADASVAERAQMIPVTDRDWDWNPIHVVYPIPTDELTRNPLCEQNPGY